jgi:hypothetical protein
MVGGRIRRYEIFKKQAISRIARQRQSLNVFFTECLVAGLPYTNNYKKGAYLKYLITIFDEGLQSLIKSKKKKYVRPTHDFFCECRNCVMSTKKFINELERAFNNES